MLISTISRSNHMTMYGGIWVPLVTPFRGGAPDLDALQALAEDLIDSGVHGLVVCGTTGEAAQLDETEQISALAAVLEVARALCPVMMGIAGSDTRAAARKVRHVDSMDLAGYLVSPPSYVRPSQEGILRHFEAIATETARPIALYNIPARTGVNMDLATIAALAARPQFAAIKEAGGNLAQMTDLIMHTPLDVLCGDDSLLFAALCAGGHGAISAAAHVRPDLYVQLFDLVRAEKLGDARTLFMRLLPMIRLLFAEPNPAPLKAVLAMQGLIREELRLPMTPVGKACRGQLADALDDLMALPRYRSPTPFSTPVLSLERL
jgi:4-hydroxy-tetrahydrodipicolinate synthase